jgi:DNA processing protein
VVELLQTFTGAPRSTYRVAEEPTDFDYAELSKLEWGEAKANPDQGERVARLLTKAPIGVDELIRQSGADAAAVHMVLLEMELAGEIERHAGGAVSRS